MMKEEKELTRIWVRWISPDYVDDVLNGNDSGDYDEFFDWWNSLSEEGRKLACAHVREYVSKYTPGKTRVEI